MFMQILCPKCNKVEHAPLACGEEIKFTLTTTSYRDSVWSGLSDAEIIELNLWENATIEDLAELNK